MAVVEKAWDFILRDHGGGFSTSGIGARKRGPSVACRLLIDLCYDLGKKSLSMLDVLALNVPERLKLVQASWDSIAAAPEAMPVTETERNELDRRLDAYYREPDAGSPWSEVKARLLGKE